MSKTVLQSVFYSGMACLLLIQLGCGGATTPEAAMQAANDSNAKRLSNLYLMIQMKSAPKFEGPKDEAEFKATIKETPSETLSPMGVSASDVDSLFVSERDGEPFEIRYGLKGSPYGSSDPVIFEKTGVDGKRTVAFLNVSAREVDADEYQQLLDGKASAGQGRGDGPTN